MAENDDFDFADAGFSEENDSLDFAGDEEFDWGDDDDSSDSFAWDDDDDSSFDEEEL